MEIVIVLSIRFKKNDSFRASYVLYAIYLTKILGTVFKSAGSNLYNQMMSKTLTFFFKKMTIRKITNENSVKYNRSANSSPIENYHDHKLTTASLPGNQNKKLP